MKPIPFAVQNLPPAALKDLIDSIKKNIENGKSFVNGLKDKYVNPLRTNIQTALNNLDKAMANNFSNFKVALPSLFANSTPSIVTARNTLMAKLGDINNTANNTSFLGMSMSSWSTLGDTLYDATNTFNNHTNEISGVNTTDREFTLQKLYGNVVITGATVNIASSTTATANLSKSVYPIVNIGTSVIVNSQERIIVGKTYTSTANGNVSVNIASDNVKVTSANVANLNLANVLLSTGSTLKVLPGMYINVNSEFKQVNTINSFGDFLTVIHPFRNSVADTILYKEVGFVVNTAYGATATDLTVSANTPFAANSVCLDNVITGNGTSFTTFLQANSKIYYADQEFYVVSVTDTRIEVDDALNEQHNEIVYKIIDEKPITMRPTETNAPDDILAAFDGILKMTPPQDQDVVLANKNQIIADLKTRYKKQDGTYDTVMANTPAAVTQSLVKTEMMNAVTRTLQGLYDDLQGDAIAALSESELVAVLDQKTSEINDLKNDIMDTVNKDLSAINAVKGFLAGLLRLMMASCSKKSKDINGDPQSDYNSDDYLNLIMKVDPKTQTCSATTGDLITILDKADEEYNTVARVTPNVESSVNTSSYTPDEFEFSDYSYSPEAEQTAGGLGDITIDAYPPEQLQPPKTVNPCTQPC